MPRKIIEFDPETLRALDLLASDSMKDLQELADDTKIQILELGFDLESLDAVKVIDVLDFVAEDAG